jgi:hypothetical protein
VLQKQEVQPTGPAPVVNNRPQVQAKSNFSKLRVRL